MEPRFKVPVIRMPKYLDWIRSKPCCFCHRAPRSEAHHVGNGGMSKKTDDVRAIPACHDCHMLAQKYDYAALRFPNVEELHLHQSRTMNEMLIEFFVRKAA